MFGRAGARWGAMLLAAVLGPAWGAGQSLNDYAQALQPPLGQQAIMENAGFAWDALHFKLATGQLALGAPVEGRATTAVFRGQGELDVAPPNAIARQQMQFLLGRPAIAMRFSEAVFRFADGAEFQKALGADAHFRPHAESPALAGVLADRAKMVRSDGLQGVARELLALDAGTSPAMEAAPGWFLAALKTHSGWIVARFDPLDAEAVEVSQYRERAAFGNQMFHDIWAHFPAAAQAGAAPGDVSPLPPPDALDDYHIDVQIPGNLDMRADASFSVRARRAGRGLLLALDPNLHITAAQLAGGAPVEYVQPHDPGRSPGMDYVGSWVYLRLPHALAPAQSVTLELHYNGKQVIQRVGPGNFFARSAGWYPTNIYGAPFQRASYHLRFENDKKYTLVATGVRQTNVRQGDEQITTWASSIPLTVAGFALGDYQETSNKVALPDGQKVAVNVLVNNSQDDLLASLSLANQFRSMAPMQAALPLGTLDPRSLAPVALAQVSSALRFMTAYFGPYPYHSLSVVPIPYGYGQGWPGLLYLSDLSFLDSTQLELLGAPKSAMDQLSDTFRAHETSHQWWGHRVGWASYHDQWLSEGFANASALLFQFAADGGGAGVDTLKQWRRTLSAKSRLGHAHEQDGALWLGQRLSSSMDPEGYQDIVYDKGGYVLYMLRQMMIDPRSKTPDAAFIAMMHDFTSTYANRNASTADFQRIVEKHMLPAMKVDGNGKMDWFFQQYVYGTGIPQLEFHVAMAPDGPHTKVTMTVDNPSGWRGLLPVYLWQGKRYVRGQLTLRGAHEESVHVVLAFRPDKIVANQYLDMLVDVKQ